MGQNLGSQKPSRKEPSATRFPDRLSITLAHRNCSAHPEHLPGRAFDFTHPPGSRYGSWTPVNAPSSSWAWLNVSDWPVEQFIRDTLDTNPFAALGVGNCSTCCMQRGNHRTSHPFRHHQRVERHGGASRDANHRQHWEARVYYAQWTQSGILWSEFE